MLKGLYDAGIDLRQADLFVGTSAGSALNAQLLQGTKTPDELYDQYLVIYGSYANPAALRYPPPLQSQYVLATNRLWQSVPYTPEIGAQVGQRALNAPNAASEGAHIAGWRAELGDVTWPSRNLKISAVDVSDGSIRLFDSTQGVPILTAVAASTAIPGVFAPITVGDHRYMDGGIAGDHVDAAEGYPIEGFPSP
jgi:NTE family protein